MHCDLILINPNTVKPAVAPLGLEYVAEAARAAGSSAALLDLCFAPEPQTTLCDFFAEHSATLVGLSLRNTDNCYLLSSQSYLPATAQVIAQLREVTDAPVVIGGAGYSIAPAQILTGLGADYGVVGDGEEPIVELLAGLKKGEVGDFPGLVHRHGEEVAVNAPAWLSPHADSSLPRQTVDYPRYFREGGQGNIETKRGCPARCIYCADPHSKGRCYRLRSPRVIADELERLLAQGIDWLHLCDSEFNLPPEHAEAVCQEIIRRGLASQLHWYAYLSPQPFSDRLAGLMKQAGCVGIDFGLDSGDDRMLARLGRDFTSEQAAETARACRQAGITFMLDLLVGAPCESRQSVSRTIEFAQRVEPSCVGVALGVRIYPHTALAALVAREGLPRQNPNLYGAVEHNADFVDPVFYLSAELGTMTEATDYLSELTAGDERFFLGGGDEDKDYDYDDNAALVEAIAAGARGAYWDILRGLRLAAAS